MRLYHFGICCVFFTIALQALQAAESMDPTGTWNWSAPSKNGKLEMKLQLEIKGDKLSGTIEGSKAPQKAISDASLSNGEIKFSVTRMREGMKVTTKYSGKLEGDTITGTAEVTKADGTTSSRKWKATRAPK